MFIVWIDDEFLYHNLWINHHYLHCVNALRRDVEVNAQPTEIVEHLAAHTLTETREIDVACWLWQGLQYFRASNVLLCVFVESMLLPFFKQLPVCS